MLCIAYPRKSLVLNASKNGFLIALRKVPYLGQLRKVFQLGISEICEKSEHSTRGPFKVQEDFVLRNKM